ncbi:hypothetical protein HY029_01065 [Candidatus Gottesmanbacteria bacterium]|nr:hypothetical protein [Candidatus Gottesmanbacteria bacterium]
MVTQELLDYIRQERAIGITPEEIKKNLLSSGWGEEDINQALSSVSAPETKKEELKFTSFFQSILNEFNTLFHDSYKQFKFGAKIYLKIQAINLIIVLGIILFSLFGVLFASFHTQPVVTLIITEFSRLVIGCLTGIPQLALLYAVNDGSDLKTLKEYLTKAKKNFLRYLGIFICTGLLTGFGALIFLIISIVANILMRISTLFGFLNIIGVICGFIVAIAYFSRYFLSVYVYANENTGIIESLRKSEYIMQDHTLRFIAHLILVSLSLVVITIVPIIGPIFAFFVGGPFVVIYMNRLYKNFKLLAGDIK